jgi:phage terminase small subunit
MDLNARQKAFCRHYASKPDAGEAYRLAGYESDGKTASDSASRLLAEPGVKAEVSRLQAAIAERAEVQAARVIREVARLALSDVRGILNEDGSLKPVSEWDDEAAACVASIETDEIWGTEGRGPDRTRVQVGVTRKIRFWDKAKALDLLMDHLGLTQRPTLESLLIFFPPDRAERIRQFLARGVGGPATGGGPGADLPRLRIEAGGEKAGG